jgi:chemotaxis protein MotB
VRRVRRSARDAGESGEGYLASVSDLMAGLIFIFVITVAVFALRLAHTIEEHEDKTEQLTSAQKTRDRILEDIKNRLEMADIKVEIVPDQGVLRLTEKGIHFESGQTQPRSDHLPRVGELARVLAEVLPCYVAKHDYPHADGRRAAFCSPEPAQPEAYYCEQQEFPARLETLLIEGHTDSEPVSSARRFRDNLELSGMRAAEVLRMLLQCEPGLHELKNERSMELLSVSGYGETRLVDEDEPLSEQNRRIDLRFLMELPRALVEVPKDGGGPESQELRPKEEVRVRYEG